MPDSLLAVLLGLVLLTVIGLVLRWTVRAEQRAPDRHLASRVYYPKRGRKAGVPTLKRRPRTLHEHP